MTSCAHFRPHAVIDGKPKDGLGAWNVSEGEMKRMEHMAIHLVSGSGELSFYVTAENSFPTMSSNCTN